MRSSTSRASRSVLRGEPLAPEGSARTTPEREPAFSGGGVISRGPRKGLPYPALRGLDLRGSCRGLAAPANRLAVQRAVRSASQLQCAHGMRALETIRGRSSVGVLPADCPNALSLRGGASRCLALGSRLHLAARRLHDGHAAWQASAQGTQSAPAQCHCPGSARARPSRLAPRAVRSDGHGPNRW